MIKAPDARRRQFFSQLLGTDAASATRRQPWRRVPEAGAGDGDVLWSGWAGDGEVFVVGDEGRILHYDGNVDEPSRQWQPVETPSRLPLHGIWGLSADRLIAVGWMGTILHWDGVQWQQRYGGIIDDNDRFAACAENTPLFAIDGNADGEAWAVGDDGMVLHYDGTEWTREPSPTQVNLRAVACAPGGQVYAAGAEGTVIQRNPGGQWVRLDCPLGSGFQAMLMTGDNELLLAGGRYFVDKGGFRGELVRYQNGQFQALDFKVDMPRLRAIRRYRKGALIVGDQGRLYYLEGLDLSPLESNTIHDLMDIVPLPTGEALAVGDFGTIMTAAEDFTQALAPPPGAAKISPWVAMTTPVNRQLWGIHEGADGTCYACGEAGTVLRLEGDRWEALPPPSELAVHCLLDTGEGLFAAGQHGRIFRFDGSAWQLHFDLHLDITILALWGDGPDCMYAVGDEGLILHFDGLGWKRMPSGTQSALYGLWGLRRDRLLAVGDFGLALRYNGQNWAEFNVGTENFLYDVWGTSLENIYAVGLSGTLAHFDGTRWQVHPIRTRDDLLSVSGTSSANAYAVGTRGQILRLQNDHWIRERSGTDHGLRAVCATRTGPIYAVGDRGLILRRSP